MAGWVIKTEFMTEAPLEHGNWSAVEFDTEEEAQQWWAAPNTRSVHNRHMTLTDPDGRVWAFRLVPVGDQG